uniref:VWFD domain-containing protein n=1 Tax=Heligmosomoides polygyrus TaxID=6339 RepID=A0A8L8Q1H6_HELPZ
LMGLIPFGYFANSASFSCWSTGNGQPARWWNEGETLTRGKYWYECQQGRLEPRGCVTDGNRKLNIGTTTEVGNYVAVCELGPDGYLQFRFSACIGEGNRHYGVGETWPDSQNMYYYECQRDGPYLRSQPKGCISHDKQRRIALGQRDDYGDYTYECRQKYNGTIQMCSVGCIHKGQHYKIGEQWPDGEFVYYCKLNGGRCQKVCIGCQHRQKRLYDGDRYHEEGSVYQCEIRPDSFGHKPVACLSKELDGSTVERVIGCRWYLQTSLSKIEQTCELVGTKTVVRTLGCIYRHNGFDTIFLSPGQYTIWNLPHRVKTSIGLACRETPDGAKLEVFDVTQLAQHTAGLKYDQPRGK